VKETCTPQTAKRLFYGEVLNVKDGLENKIVDNTFASHEQLEMQIAHFLKYHGGRSKTQESRDATVSSKMSVYEVSFQRLNASLITESLQSLKFLNKTYNY